MDWLAVIMNIVNRVPIERVLFRPPDHTKALEDFARSLPHSESPKEAPPEQKTTVTTKTPEKVAQSGSTGIVIREALSEPKTTPTTTHVAEKAKDTACNICSLDHISTCAGILEEANRFARREGIGSPEVIRKISICRQQLNALERDDANPQKLVELPRIERKIMERILPKEGELRHRLNEIVSLETLEQVAAEAQDLNDQFQNEIFHLQLKRELAKNEIRNLKPDATPDELENLQAEALEKLAMEKT